MGDSKIKTVKAEVKETEKESDDRIATVKDLMDLLKNIDPSLKLSIRLDLDYNEEESEVNLSSLKENFYIKKEEYIFAKENKYNKNYLVMDAFNF